MALEFTLGIDDKASGPAKSAAAGLLTAASAAQILTGKLAATDAALLVATATGARASAIAKLTQQQASLAAAIAKVAPAAAKYAAVEQEMAGYAANLAAEEKAHTAALVASAAAQKAAAEQAKAATVAKTAADVAAVKTLGVLRDSLGAAAQGMREFGSAVLSGDAGGAVKGLADGVAGAAKSLDLLVPGLGQAASAVIAFGGAVAGVTVGALQSMAEKSLDAVGSLKLLTAQLGALSNGKASGEQLVEVVEEVASQTGQARAEVGRLARTFEGIGLTDLDNLKGALLAAKSSATISADGTSTAFEKLENKIQAAADSGNHLKIGERGLEAIAKTGARADEVAAKLGVSTAVLDASLKAGTQDAAKFGHALQEALVEKGATAVDAFSTSISAFEARFANATEKLFEGVNTKPLTDQLAKLPALLDNTTASGRAMKAVITTAMDAVFDGAAKVVPILRTGFVGALYLAVVALDFLEEHSTGVKVVLAGLAVGAVLLALPFIAIGIAVTAVVVALGAVSLAVVSVIQAFSEIGPKATAAGTALVDGLVDGITAGASRIASAASAAASAAVDAAKSVLGIASPSTVFAEVGVNVTRGMALGIGAGTHEVKAASRSLARSPIAEAGRSAGAGSSRGGGGGGGVVNHFHFAPGALSVQGGGKEAEGITEELLALVFERLAASQGLGAGS